MRSKTSIVTMSSVSKTHMGISLWYTPITFASSVCPAFERHRPGGSSSTSPAFRPRVVWLSRPTATSHEPSRHTTAKAVLAW